MKPITEEQIRAIHQLAKVTNTEISDVEKMSSSEASQVINALIEKRTGGGQYCLKKNRHGKAKHNDHGSKTLAILAIKILAQQCQVHDIIAKPKRFKIQAVQLYKVFNAAKHPCFRSPEQ